MTTLKQRVLDAFVGIGMKMPADDTNAIALGGAVLQCQTDHEAGMVCSIVRDEPAMMRRNAQLMVFLCQSAGWPEPECDQWIGSQLRAIAAAKRAGVYKDVKQVGELTFEMSVDYPPRLVVLKVTEAANVAD